MRIKFHAEHDIDGKYFVGRYRLNGRVEWFSYTLSLVEAVHEIYSACKWD